MTQQRKKKYKEFSLKFGKHLRKLRKERKLSQEELAKRAGCNISFIGSIERGQKTPTLQTIAKIADGLEIHITKLFDLSHQRGTENELNQKLEDRFYAILNESDPNTLQLVGEILEGILNHHREPAMVK